MNQDNKTQGQQKHGQMGGQTGKPQGSHGGSQTDQGREKMGGERGNPSTTERIQPEPNRVGGQRPEGDNPGKREQSGQNKF